MPLTFEEVVDAAVAMLKRRQRVTYRLLKRQFELDNEALVDLVTELIDTQRAANDEDGRTLVWTDDASVPQLASAETAEGENRFYALLPAVIAFLRQEGRLTYRMLKDVFALDDGLLAEICEELRLRRVADDEAGKVLVWAGEAQLTPLSRQPAPVEADAVRSRAAHAPRTPFSEPSRPAFEAERRQLTVMFCDLVGSTDLSSRLDPEAFREVVRAYQKTAAAVIERYEGYIAQYLGDGLLIYFGFPSAHEDDAARAVYTGLEITEVLTALNTRLQVDYNVTLAVRIGIHTGPVVVGEMGGGDRHENLALGETPNIAARLENLASPNAIVVSLVTAQLVQRMFILEELGSYELKGVAEPMVLYAVSGLRATEPDDEVVRTSRFEVLVGRDEEIGLLLRRWEQSKEGLGQVVLLSGEAGIGKSSMVEGLRDHVSLEEMIHVTLRCSPYHTNSAFYPMIEYIQRLLDWRRDDTAETQLVKLEQGLEDTSLALEDAVPILAALLSLKLPEERYPALSLTPQQQRQQTQDFLVAWLLEVAERQPILAVWEDLHWVDPSTLEVLGLLVEQTPTVAMCQVLTFRPEFEPTWPTRSHLTPITLSRLERPQVEALVADLAGGKALPPEVVEHIVIKTDGVPLYVEELTKMLLESNLLRDLGDAYVLTGPINAISIPATLQDSLMARLDQLGRAREIAQLGAVMGREFSYEMLQLLSEMTVAVLNHDLSQLVEAELLYQRGRPPRATYVFKHALIQDAAYQSLLKSRRQQLHQQIAEMLETHFVDTVSAQPELVARHYTEAGLYPQAMAAWQQAGVQAFARVAYREAAVSSEYAIDALHQLPKSEQTPELTIDLLLLYRNAIFPFGDHDRVIELLREAETIAETLEDQRRLGQILTLLCISFISVRGLDEAVESGQRALAIAETHAYDDLRIIASVYLGGGYYQQGSYQQVIDMLTPIVRSLVGDAVHAYYGLSNTPSVVGRSVLAWSLSELGQFTEGAVHGEDAMLIAEALDNARAINTSHFSAAIVALRQGHISRAIPLLERSLQICRDTALTIWFGMVASLMSYAYAQAGQLEQARQLLAEVPEPTNAIGFFAMPYFVEAMMFTGRLSYAYDVATRSLDITRAQNARGDQAHLLRLLGDLASRRGAGGKQAQTFYHQALSIAEELGMRPLQAHCHLGLGTRYGKQGEREFARQELAKAQALYREMDMTCWLPQVETALSTL